MGIEYIQLYPQFYHGYWSLDVDVPKIISQ